MPSRSFRELTSRERTATANRRLGTLLAFVAGAINAGGLLIVHRYTSHMTGIVSAIADSLALADFAPAAVGCLLVGAFILGAMTTSIMVNWSRRRAWIAEYAPPVALESLLLLIFGLATLHEPTTDIALLSATALLCFGMGLQNAIITKVSRAEIRTTHVTGLTTDIGIELGRMLSGKRGEVNTERLRLHAWLLCVFLAGGVCGALGFHSFGGAATFPIALLLGLVAVPSIVRDAIR